MAYVEGETRTVLLDVDRPELLPRVLTDSAAVIWTLIDGDRTDAEIVAAVAASYEQPVDSIADAVLGFLDALTDEGFVELIADHKDSSPSTFG